MSDLERWYCPSCGIVRDRPGPAPICHHNVPTSPTPAAQMQLIQPWHPLATGPLTWGTDDPARSDA